MKKVVKAVVCLSLAAAGFIGCSGKESKKADEPVKLAMTWWGNQTRNERTQKVLDMFTAANPKVTFDPQFAEWADYWNKLATSAAGHQMPDIVQMDYKYINQYAEKNLLADLTPYTQNGTLDTSKINEGILKAGTVNSKLVAVCNGVNAPALLYNKSLLDSKGITVKDNMTLDEFIALCKDIYKKTGCKTNVSYGSNEIFLEYTMRGIGKTGLFGDKKFTADSASDFDIFFNIYEEGTKEEWLVSPSIFSERTIGSVEQDPMIYGTKQDSMSWCAFVYSNQTSAFNKAKPADMTLGITTWPAVDPAKANYLKPSQFFSVSTDSKNPEKAAAVINFLTNNVDCNNVLLGERGIPPASNVADAIAPQLDAIQQTVVNYINKVVTPNCSAISAPAPANAAEVFTLINSLEEQICYKTITAKQASQELFTKGNEILAK